MVLCIRQRGGNSLLLYQIIQQISMEHLAPNPAVLAFLALLSWGCLWLNRLGFLQLQELHARHRWLDYLRGLLSCSRRPHAQGHTASLTGQPHREGDTQEDQVTGG